MTGGGGVARQQFSLDVLKDPGNRPPYFTTTPVVQGAVGRKYEYRAAGFDLDQDPLSFERLDGPTGLAVAKDGTVTWDFPLPGEYPVSIRVADGRGGTAVQNYLLAAGQKASNPSAPQLFGTPSIVASVSQLYLYQPVAFDPDVGQKLTFSLAVAPTGARIDVNSGRLTWRPGATQKGVQSFTLRVSDGKGGSAQQSWKVDVTDKPSNGSPVIHSVPALRGEKGKLYSYNAQARDPNGDSVTFSLVSAPAGMTVRTVPVGTANVGEIRWTPAATGTFLIAIRAADGKGGFGSQVYRVVVKGGNRAPSITSVAVTTAVAGGAYRYLVNATDPDRDPLQFELVSGPAGMAMHRYGGMLTWSPSVQDVGKHPVKIRVIDGRGEMDEQSFTVEVAKDTAAPRVEIQIGSNQARLNSTVRIRVGATDNVRVVAKTLEVDTQKVALDKNGWGEFVPKRTGDHILLATATDPSGNKGSTKLTLKVVDGNPGAPNITLHSPAPETLISEPTDIVATIKRVQTTGTLTWEVLLRRAGSSSVRSIAKGTGEVTNKLVAVIDPTILPNDPYFVDLVASEPGRKRTTTFRVSVCGEQKLGQFKTTVVDLTARVGGIPLVISRSYDSLDDEQRDFGKGWSLVLPGDVMDNAAEAGSSTGLQPFHSGTRVYVTLPNGRRVGFTFNPVSIGGFFGFFLRPLFQPDPGVLATLEVTGETFVVQSGGSFYTLFDPFNPREYRLTTRDGVQYTIDEFDGLKRIEDIRGNTVTVKPEGLVSSAGLSMRFVRDAEGRITKIHPPEATASGVVSPNPNVVQSMVMALASQVTTLDYEYDAKGNLVKFTDLDGNPTRYHYTNAAFPNYLTGVDDPLGRPMLRNVFDADGRMIYQCGPDGDIKTGKNCIQFQWQPGAKLQTLTNARGFQTTYLTDAMGNVLTERRWMDTKTFAEVARKYNADGLLLEEKLPSGALIRQEYDKNGNRVAYHDPSGESFKMEYDAEDRLTKIIGPSGGATQFTWDKDGNLRLIEDPMGGKQEAQYDTSGNITLWRDAVGNTWNYTYSRYGTLETVRGPRGKVRRTHHDLRGNLVWAIDRNGLRVDYERDGKGRVTKETWATSPKKVIEYDYNGVGGLIRVEDDSTKTVADWWPTGLLKSVTTTIKKDAKTYTVTYGHAQGSNLLSGYDGNGNLTHVRDSLGGMTEYAYDAFDYLSGAKQYAVGGSVLDKRVEVDRTPTGILTSLRRFADLTSTTPISHTSVSYLCKSCPNRRGGLTHFAQNKSVWAAKYGYDSAGNLTSIQDVEGEHTYRYDALGRMIAAAHPAGSKRPGESYRYDAIGNRLSSHLSAKYSIGYLNQVGGNQLIADDSYTYAYDNEGRLTRRSDKKTGDYVTFGYHITDQVNRVQAFDKANVNTYEATYVYDGLRRRVKSVENGVVRFYMFDHENPIAVMDAKGAVVTRRFYSRSIDGVLAEEAAGKTKWYLKDHVGSVVGVLSSTGVVENELRYDSFGRLMWQSASAAQPSLLFNGRSFDAQTGLGFWRARTYDPSLGRFMQRDPVDPFRYDFVNGAPLTNIDPLGTVTMVEYVNLVLDKVDDILDEIACPLAKLWNNVAENLSPALGGGKPPRNWGSFALCEVYPCVRSVTSRSVKGTYDNCIKPLCSVCPK